MQDVSEATTSEKIREYLLGNLAEDGSAEVERQLLDDDQFFEELLIIEDELVDQYFAGRLTDGEKLQFETHFLVAPERLARLRFSKVFNRYLELNDSPTLKSEILSGSSIEQMGKPSRGFYWPFQRPLVAVSLSLAILFVSCTTYWLLSRRGGNLESTQKVVSVGLMPGTLRSGGTTQRVEITPDAGRLQLELGLGSVDFSAYRAELLAEGETVNVFEGLKPITTNGRHHVVVSTSPPANGDYQVKLSGVSSSGQLELVNSYTFRIIRP